MHGSIRIAAKIYPTIHRQVGARVLSAITDIMVKRSNDEAAPKASKRPKTDGPKFYAVRKGVTPGIYNSWKDCQDQITGYPGAQCEYRRVVYGIGQQG